MTAPAVLPALAALACAPIFSCARRGPSPIQGLMSGTLWGLTVL